MISKEVFNSSVEVGARIVLLLSGLNLKLSLDDLVFFDYALIYSRDFQGEESLHPALLNRLAELVRRREIFPDSIKLYASKGLLTTQVDELGVRYSITLEGREFAERLSSPYHRNFASRVPWIAENIERLRVQKRMTYKLDRVV
ncbi:ABC-three component system middle component 2 [Pseudomonas sp. BS3782 TE3695]|uniref:ABC-three component system middle component 2 n=1 Tax=Pseudomonas TaxID=286 RepID=UPI003D21D662